MRGDMGGAKRKDIVWNCQIVDKIFLKQGVATCIPNANFELAEADGAPQPMEDAVSKYKALEEQRLSLTSGFHMCLYVGLH